MTGKTSISRPLSNIAAKLAKEDQVALGSPRAFERLEGIGL